MVQANNDHVQDLQTAHDKYAAKEAEQEARLQRAEEKIKEMEQQVSTAHNKVAKAEEKVKEMEEQASTAQNKANIAGEKVKEMEEQASTTRDKVAKVEADLQEKETARQAAQSELDDLLMVFGDMEEKMTKYKERLKALGENVSDDEDGDDDDDDDEDEEESGVD